MNLRSCGQLSFLRNTGVPSAAAPSRWNTLRASASAIAGIASRIGRVDRRLPQGDETLARIRLEDAHRILDRGEPRRLHAGRIGSTARRGSERVPGPFRSNAPHPVPSLRPSARARVPP